MRVLGMVMTILACTMFAAASEPRSVQASNGIANSEQLVLAPAVNSEMSPSGATLARHERRYDRHGYRHYDSDHHGYQHHRRYVWREPTRLYRYGHGRVHIHHQPNCYWIPGRYETTFEGHRIYVPGHWDCP
ncbi:MAG: hypothetical protein HY706_19690 [Candidatus Hydrogenedentes bacterium]|nr:hypothetical protein [Candidatus Hydrogenedentota bacterium]